MTINDFKTCNVCGEYKLLEDFHKHKTGKMGVMSTCKCCQYKREKNKRKNKIKFERMEDDPVNKFLMGKL